MYVYITGPRCVLRPYLKHVFCLTQESKKKNARTWASFPASLNILPLIGGMKL